MDAQALWSIKLHRARLSGTTPTWSAEIIIIQIVCFVQRKIRIVSYVSKSGTLLRDVGLL